MKPFVESVPGPGAYTIGGSIGTSRQNQFSMGTRTKILLPGSASPGPGAYSVSVPSHRIPISMKGRGKDSSTANSPGPGNYSITNTNLPRAPQFTMQARPSTSAALATPGAISPGPGAYDISKPLSSTRGITLKSRPLIDKDSANTPGPGQYNVTDANLESAPKFTMSTRLVQGSAMRPAPTTPGPGAYSLPSTVGSAPAITVACRREIPPHSHSTPGPAAYANTDASVVARRAPQFSIGARTALPEMGGASPGPAAYVIPPHRVRPITMSGRPKDKPSNLSFPGPAHYANTSGAATSPRSPAYSMLGRPVTAGPIFAPAPSITPGPGAYDTTRALRSDRAISLKGRPTIKSDGDLPGPGAYNIPSGNNGPKITMGIRYPLPADDD